MAVSYASLQLSLEAGLEAAQERIIYAVTACMDRQGMIPCDKGNAERTVAFVRTEKGWAVFDDCADRLDIAALDQLGKGLTHGLHSRAVGVMRSAGGTMLKLYGEGRVRDTYMSPAAAFGKRRGCWLRCRGHALRWRLHLAPGCSLKELTALFIRGETDEQGIFEEICGALDLDESAEYGFASLEDAGLQGVVRLYFRASNLIKQRLWDKPWKLARYMGSTVGVFFHRRASGTKGK